MVLLILYPFAFRSRSVLRRNLETKEIYMFSGLNSFPNEPEPKMTNDQLEKVTFSASEQAAHFYMLGVILGSRQEREEDDLKPLGKS